MSHNRGELSKKKGQQVGGAGKTQKRYTNIKHLTSTTEAINSPLMISTSQGYDPPSNTLEAVSNILSQQPSIAACYLRPHPQQALFIAWNGVIVLVYDRFPPSLVQAKTKIASNNNNDDGVMLHLTEENFGSKWPKTTLGAVRDGVDELTLEQFEKLRDLCNQYSKRIITASSSSSSSSSEQLQNHTPAESNRIKVATLSVVQYACRGLERLEKRIDITLDDSPHDDVEEDNSKPSDEEQSRVNSVISEWNDAQAYLPRVNAPGSHIGSYRQDTHGNTCVAFIDSAMPSYLRKCLSEFRNAVNDEFSGRYVWLDESSLHCTLRSLD